MIPRPSWRAPGRYRKPRMAHQPGTSAAATLSTHPRVSRLRGGRCLQQINRAALTSSASDTTRCTGPWTAGRTGTNITGPLALGAITDIAVDPSDSQVVYLALGNIGSAHLYKSTDALAPSPTWTQIDAGLPGLQCGAGRSREFECCVHRDGCRGMTSQHRWRNIVVAFHERPAQRSGLRPGRRGVHRKPSSPSPMDGELIAWSRGDRERPPAISL